MRVWLVSLMFFPSISDVALGKGLDELGQSNPEAASEVKQDSGDETKNISEKNLESSSASLQQPSPLSKIFAEKLQLGTSFGWIRATKSTGRWTTSGVSDIVINYRILALNAQVNLLGTFRYLPVAVSGTEENHVYRGVWEIFNFGARSTYRATPKLDSFGSAEIGYVKSSLNPIDGLPEVFSHSKDGAMLTFGGGVDYAFLEGSGFVAGPRIFAGLGTYSAFQLSAAASFVF